MSVATVYSLLNFLRTRVLSDTEHRRQKGYILTYNFDTVICRKCGRKLVDLDIDEEGFFKSASTAQNSIAQIDNAEVFLYGLCTDCFSKK